AGVGDLDAQAVAAAVGADVDGAALGEAGGVADDAADHLGELAAVVDDVAERWVEVDAQGRVVALDLGAVRLDDLAQDVGEREAGGGEGEATGLELGDVEDVGDDGEQAAAGAGDL